MAQGKANPRTVIEGDRRRIKITQAEIDKAAPQRSGRCLVARAIAAKFPDASRIDVDNQTIRFTRAGERWVYLTPWAVQRYIVEFDAGDPIDPFEFSLTQSVQIQRKERTDAGRAEDAARDRAKRARRKLAKADQGELALAETERAQLAEVIDRAAVEREAVRAVAKATGEPLERRPRPELPPRAAMTQRGVNRSRTSKRHYGSREMRINQDRAERTAQAKEAEVGLNLPPMPKGGYSDPADPEKILARTNRVRVDRASGAGPDVQGP